MITVNEKVDFFRKIVLDRIDHEYQELEDSLAQSFQSEAEKFKEEARKKSENYIDKFVTKAQNEKKLRVLESKRVQKEKILAVKNKLIEKIHASVLDRASNLIGKDQYYELIHQLMVKGKNELKDFDSYRIELCEKDYENRERIKSIIKKYLDEKPLEFRKSKTDFNGGLIIMDMKEEMKLDLSLKSIILRNKVFIGNQVQRLLDEKSDVNE